MNQFVLTKTINARRRRLKIRRVVNYTCETKEEEIKHKHFPTPTTTTTTTTEGRREISVLLKPVFPAAAAEEGGSRVVSSGSVSVIGGRKEMEDAVSVEELVEGYDFFGVYDGHGGARVADACRERMHKVVAEEIAKGGEEWGEVMGRSFVRMDGTVDERDGMMGSTAVVAVVGKAEVVVANCGDSRAVLCRKGVALPLSIDHKPDRPDELERVEAAGGRVINWNGHRVLGVLSTSRSIGDQYLKPYIIPDPEVAVHKRTQEDDFLILASDGLWDVISNEVACRVAARCLRGRMRRRGQSPEAVVTSPGGRAAEAAAVLSELAMARGSTDNISVIVVELNRSGSGGASTTATTTFT